MSLKHYKLQNPRPSVKSALLLIKILQVVTKSNQFKTFSNTKVVTVFF